MEAGKKAMPGPQTGTQREQRCGQKCKDKEMFISVAHRAAVHLALCVMKSPFHLPACDILISCSPFILFI